MKVTLQLRFALFIVAGLLASGCNTTQTLQQKPSQAHVPEKPSDVGRAVEAGPDLKRFLISHGFHCEAREVYTRKYHSLREAGEDMGISLVNLRVSENGPDLEYRDERVFWLNGWSFTVLAEKGRTLDDLNTPCTVDTSLIQVQ